MKKMQEIIGLPIISITDGIEVGRIQSVIINAEKGAIDFIVVDSGVQILSGKVIPSDTIIGIGEYALTIEDENSISDISKIPSAIDLLQKNIVVRGNRVLTKKGRLIGEIGDIYIDEEESCKIIGLEFYEDAKEKQIKIIPRNSIITYGKNLVVVQENIESVLLDSPFDLIEDEMPDMEKNAVKVDSRRIPYVVRAPKTVIEETVLASDVSYEEEDDLSDTNDDTSDADEMDIAFLNEEEINILNENGQGSSELSLDDENHDVFSVGVTISKSSNNNVRAALSSLANQKPQQVKTESNAASLFEQRQRQYLNGRRTTKVITDSHGSMLVSEGTIISDDVVDVVKQHGKLIELVMNNRA